MYIYIYIYIYFPCLGVVPVHDHAMRDVDAVQVPGVVGRVAEQIQAVAGPVLLNLRGERVPSLWMLHIDMQEATQGQINQRRAEAARTRRRPRMHE